MAKKKVSRKILKNLDNWDWLFIGLLAIIILVEVMFFAKFQQLPGPVYGGDVYYHYGHINHIADGGGVVKNSHYANEYEAYPWLNHFAIAFLAWIIPGASVFSAAILIFPILVLILTAVIVYSLGLKLLNNKPVAMLLSLLWVSTDIPTLTPSSSALFLMVPLLFYFLYYAESMYERLGSGIVVGLLALQHLTTFMGAFIAIGLLFVGRTLSNHLKFQDYKLKIIKPSKFFNTIKEQIIFFLPIIIVGVLIGLLYLIFPFFVYGGETPNPWQEYTQTLDTLTIPAVIKASSHVFFYWGNTNRFLMSILAIVGLFACFKLKKRGLPFTIFLVGVIGYAHPLITTPLLGTSFGYYKFPMFFTFARYIFVGIGIYFLYLLVKNTFKKVHYQYLFTILILGLVVFNFNFIFKNYEESQWVRAGMSLPDSTKALFDMADFIKSGTSVNDVFIATHGESLFALNALTGRKVIFMRRTHASPFVEINEKIADAAVILYGDNRELAAELVKKYNINFFYEDSYSARSRQDCVNAWAHFESSPDASYSCFITSPMYADYLTENGIEFKKVNARLDPSSAAAPRYEMLAIKPKDELSINLTIIHQSRLSNGAIMAALGRVVI